MKDETLSLGVSKAKAKQLLREINRLERKYKRLPTDEEVLLAASDIKSAFHELVFNVSEAKAAQAYHLARVQLIMRQLVAIRSTVSGERVQFRLFVRSEDGYERITDISPDSATAQSIGRKLVADIASAKRRAEAWRVIVGSHRQGDAQLVSEYLDKAAAVIEGSEKPLERTA